MVEKCGIDSHRDISNGCSLSPGHISPPVFVTVFTTHPSPWQHDNQRTLPVVSYALTVLSDDVSLAMRCMFARKNSCFYPNFETSFLHLRLVRALSHFVSTKAKIVNGDFLLRFFRLRRARSGHSPSSASRWSFQSLRVQVFTCTERARG